jgi:hypothetical protein
MTYKQYKGFKFSQIGTSNIWQLTFPSGFRTRIEAENEDEIKTRIDALGG